MEESSLNMQAQIFEKFYQKLEIIQVTERNQVSQLGKSLVRWIISLH